MDRNKDCLSDTELMDFALRPLSEENSSAAVHIMGCPECAGKLDLMNQILLSTAEVTPEEEETIQSFLSSRGGKIDLWRKIESLLSSIRLPDLSLPEFPELRLAAASSEPRMAAGKRRAEPQAAFHIDLTFQSDCHETCFDFWRVILRVDPEAGSEAELPIFVTGHGGKPIMNGELELTGRLLPVKNGMSSITLGQFRSGLKEKTVALRTASGKRVIGSLIFVLED